MDTAFLNFLLRCLGTGLLVAAGGAGGMAACAHKKSAWQEVYAVSRLFSYMQQLLAYQALTGEELLQRAKSYPQFTRLGMQSCTRLETLPLPDTIVPSLREEIRSDLHQLSMAPRETACRTLQHLATVCEEVAMQKEKEAQMAEKLWPRLGICLGALAAILMW